MPRPQFTLRALLVLMFGACCFFGGMALQRRLDKPSYLRLFGRDAITLPDGTFWVRYPAFAGEREELAEPPELRVLWAPE